MKLMGLSDPSTWVLLAKFDHDSTETYEERACHQNKNTGLTRGLGVESIGAVLDLLEGQVLYVHVSCIRPQPKATLTWSFSTIAGAPRTPDASNVSIEWGRCPIYISSCVPLVMCVMRLRKAGQGRRGFHRRSCSSTRRTAL